MPASRIRTDGSSGPNRTLRDRLGLSQEELSGRTSFDLEESPVAAVVDVSDRDALERDEPLELVERLPDSQGRTHVWKSIRFPLRSAEGQRLLGLVAMELSDGVDVPDSGENENDGHLLMELASDGMCVADQRTGRHLDVNQMMCRMLGYSREELLSMTVVDTLPEADRLSLPPRLSELREGHTLRTERHLLRKDGSTVPVEISSRMLPDGRYHAIIRDITERRKGEEELRHRLEVEALTGEVAAALVGAGGDSFEPTLRDVLARTGRFLDADRCFILQVEHGRLRQIGWSAPGAEIDNRTFEAVSGQGEQWIREAIERGTEIIVPDVHVPGSDQSGILRRLGVRSAAAVPITCGEETRGVFGIHRMRTVGAWSEADVRQLKVIAEIVAQALARDAAQRRLAESEQQYRALIEQASDPIFVANREGQILEVNEAGCRVAGAPREALIGRSIYGFTREDLSASLIWSTHEIVRGERTFLRADGAERVAEISARQLRDGRIQCILRDVTERKRIEREQARRHEVDQLLNELSRDLVGADAEGFDPAVNRLLRRMGEWAGVDRCYLFQLSNDRQSLRNTHEWCRAGIEPQIEQLQDVPASVCPWFMERLERLEPVMVRSLDDLPEEASGERDLLAALEVPSLLLLPISKDGSLFGFFGFDSVRDKRSWFEEEVAGLRMASELFIHTWSRIEAERRVRERDERFRLAAQATRDAIYDWDIRADQTEWTDGLQSSFGYPAAGGLRTLDSWIASLHPEDRTATVSSLDQALRSDAPSWTGEYRIRRGNGEFAWIVDRGMIVRNETGEAIRMTGAITDLTIQHEATRQIEQSERHFRALIENSTDILSILDLDGTIRYESPSMKFVLGFDPEELTGTNAFDLVHPDDLPQVRNIFLEAIGTGLLSDRATFRSRHKDGSWRFVEAVGQDLRNDPAIAGIVINTRDVTDRVILEKQLELSERLQGLGHLAATIAHEFNNVLMGIQPFAQMISRRSDDLKILKSVDHILVSVDRGRRVAQEILRYTRPSDPALGEVRVAEWLESFASHVEPMLPPGIAIRTQCDSREMVMLADPDQMHQVMMNLALNARDAMPDGGRLVLRAQREPREASYPWGHVEHPEAFVHLSVEDDGRGIDPADLRHIFDPLFTTRRTGATGLGLAVAHQIVTRHDGAIFVESKVSRGTRFHLFIPLGQDSDDSSRGAEQPAIAVRPRRLLLVDDDDLVASGIGELLELDGWDFRSVSAGHQAIAAVEEFGPDLVLLDVHLPDLDGIEVFRRLRKRWPDLPIIFSSGHVDRDRLTQAMEDPRVFLLLKPYGVESLQAIAEEALQSSAASGHSVQVKAD